MLKTNLNEELKSCFDYHSAFAYWRWICCSCWAAWFESDYYFGPFPGSNHGKSFGSLSFEVFKKFWSWLTCCEKLGKIGSSSIGTWLSFKVEKIYVMKTYYEHPCCQSWKCCLDERLPSIAVRQILFSKSPRFSCDLHSFT